jgi:hypothetical protein
MTNVFRKEYRVLTDDEKATMGLIKDNAQKLWESIDLGAPADQRMIAIAKTNIEQAIMWAIKAIT